MEPRKTPFLGCVLERALPVIAGEEAISRGRRISQFLLPLDLTKVHPKG